MKKNNRKQKYILTAILGSFTLVGAMALVVDQKPQYKSAEAITYNDTSKIVELNSDELANDYFENFIEYAKSQNASGIVAYWVVDQGQAVEVDTTTKSIKFTDDESNIIYAQYETYEDREQYKIYYYDNTEEEIVSWNNKTFNISFSSTAYTNYKTEFQKDIRYNESQVVGDTMIDAITSGLGLTPDIAKEFLNGFTELFWKNDNLTSVSQFMLVMLGIAIVMAIIKLSLSLIRSNTGA